MRRAGSGLAAFAAAVALAGCGIAESPPSPSPPAPARSAVSASSSTRPASSFTPPASSPTAPVATASLPPPSPGAQAPIDPALLAHLPATVDGLDVVREDDGLEDAVRNPAIRRNAKRIASALAVDPAGGEFVWAAVVEFHAGRVTDDFFARWRDSFDEGACSQAGGVARHAEAEIDGRTVDIGTCAGGVRTYHVRLGRDLVVSVWSIGERRLGEQLVAGLRE